MSFCVLSIGVSWHVWKEMAAWLQWSPGWAPWSPWKKMVLFWVVKKLGEWGLNMDSSLQLKPKHEGHLIVFLASLSVRGVLRDALQIKVCLSLSWTLVPDHWIQFSSSSGSGPSVLLVLCEWAFSALMVLLWEDQSLYQGLITCEYFLFWFFFFLFFLPINVLFFS